MNTNKRIRITLFKYKALIIFILCVAIIALVLGSIGFGFGITNNNSLNTPLVSEIIIDVPINGSLQDALLKLPTNPTISCVIQLPDGPINLGTNPMLMLFPGVRNCERIVIKGVRKNIIEDTVQDITSIATESYNWKRITGVNGNYPNAMYSTKFIENLDYERVYVIDNNTDTTIDTIIGDIYLDLPSLDLPTNSTIVTPWDVGNKYMMFTLNSSIQWSGSLTFEIPYNIITFENVIFDPLVDESHMRLPDGPQHRVIFRSCHMNARSTTGSYQGSMLIQGSYGKGVINDVFFTTHQRGRCVRTESLWVDNVILVYTGVCSAYGLKTSFAPSIARSFQVQSGDFVGSNIYIYEPQIQIAVNILVGANAVIQGMRIDRCINSGWGILLDVVSQMTLWDIDIRCAVRGINSQEGTNSRILGFMNIDALNPFILSPGAQMDILTKSFTVSGYTTSVWLVFGNSLLNIISSAGPINSITNQPIVNCAGVGSHIILGGLASSYNWSTSGSSPLVRALNGCSISRPSGQLINNGGIPGNILICGTNLISSWSISENDLSTNTFCT